MSGKDKNWTEDLLTVTEQEVEELTWERDRLLAAIDKYLHDYDSVDLALVRRRFG